jgi:hypothetical protein
MGNFERSIYGSISFTQIQCKILFLVHFNYFSICCLQCFLFFNWKYLLFNVSFSFLFFSDQTSKWLEWWEGERNASNLSPHSFFFWPSHLTTDVLKLVSFLLSFPSFVFLLISQSFKQSLWKHSNRYFFT